RVEERRLSVVATHNIFNVLLEGLRNDRQAMYVRVATSGKRAQDLRRPMGSRLHLGATIDQLLAAARARIRRYEPAEVPAEAVLVDIRAADTRARAGVVPGALHIPRTVLEWRVAPGSKWRTPHLAGAEQLVLLCDHGYSSSLAA